MKGSILYLHIEVVIRNLPGGTTRLRCSKVPRRSRRVQTPHNGLHHGVIQSGLLRSWGARGSSTETSTSAVKIAEGTFTTA